MPDKRLVAALLIVLRKCEMLGLPFQKIDLDSDNAVLTFAEVLGASGVTAEMLLENQDRICLLKEFPTPGSIRELLDDDIENFEPLPLVSYQLPGRSPIVGRPGLTDDEVEAEYQRLETPTVPMTERPALPAFMEEDDDV